MIFCEKVFIRLIIVRTWKIRIVYWPEVWMMHQGKFVSQLLKTRMIK